MKSSTQVPADLTSLFEALPGPLQDTVSWLASHHVAAMIFLFLILRILASLFRLYPSRAMVLWFVGICLVATASVSPIALGGVCLAGAVVIYCYNSFKLFPVVRSTPLRWALRSFALFVTCGSVALYSFPIAVLAMDMSLVAFMFVDLLMLPWKSSFGVERQMLTVASLKKKHSIELIVSNKNPWRVLVDIRDDFPQEFELDTEEFEVVLKPRTKITLKYFCEAYRRGSYQLSYVYMRIQSLLGLWVKLVDLECPATLRVYPDMQQLGEYAILARTNRLSLMGLRRTRKIGQDNEFERLRDYTVDDNFRHIDWRSTARRNKLTVRDFQANQSQRLMFMLDCGRMMTNESQGITMLDHSINAMLMASYVALQKGDSVGLIAFSDRVHAYVPCKGSMSQLNQLIHAVHDLHPQLVESRFDQAFFYLSQQCRKRSLVLLLTNVVDEVNGNQIESHLTSVAKKHLALGVFLRDHQIFDVAEVGTESLDMVYKGAVATEIINWRSELLMDLAHRNVIALDCFPEDMTAPLVNKYLEIKARHLL